MYCILNESVTGRVREKEGYQTRYQEGQEKLTQKKLFLVFSFLFKHLLGCNVLVSTCFD